MANLQGWIGTETMPEDLDGSHSRALGLGAKS